MISKLKLAFWGLIISFLGTIPLGTLNMSALQISIQEGIKQGLLFSVGVFMVEMIYVRVSLVGMDWINRKQRLLNSLQWVSVLMILALSAGSFWAAFHPSANSGNLVLNNNANRFLMGIIMSAVNPVQIPFWLGWSTVLSERGILVKSRINYNVYITGVGMGTFLGLLVFVFGGKWAANKIVDEMNYVNGVIGLVFLITALLLLIRLLNKSKKK
jgi:threonine/homoserine/homoserine lactone efflux protein